MQEKINVMVNGLPGKMASKALEHIFTSDDMELLPFSLTGQGIEQPTLEIMDYIIELIKPDDKRRGDLYLKKPFIAVDYAADKSKPNLTNEQANFYCMYGLSFVMGATGGDRKALEERVKNSEVCAVIAPNMAKQIVAFQAMMEFAAQNFPSVFKSYSLEIRESHQSGKADTSGTAKAMVGYFNKLGIPFTPDQIVMVRDPEEQIKMGVQEAYLNGHGWHTYTLKSSDGTVLFNFTHNVNGRDIYAAGTIDAIRYLFKKLKEGKRGKVYSMVDVLKGN